MLVNMVQKLAFGMLSQSLSCIALMICVTQVLNFRVFIPVPGRHS